MGESTSDYLVHNDQPRRSPSCSGSSRFLVRSGMQFRRRRYIAWAYWFAVVMVGVFGTMAADVLHVGLGVPVHRVDRSLRGRARAVFVDVADGPSTRSRSTPSTPRVARPSTGRRSSPRSRWAPPSVTSRPTRRPRLLHLDGALRRRDPRSRRSASAFLRWNAVFSFWFAYVVTRPLGASFADGLGKPKIVERPRVGCWAGQFGADLHHRLLRGVPCHHASRRAAGRDAWRR